MNEFGPVGVYMLHHYGAGVLAAGGKKGLLLWWPLVCHPRKMMGFSPGSKVPGLGAGAIKETPLQFPVPGLG